MVSILSRYKGFVIGFFVTFLLGYGLESIGFLLIDYSEWEVNIPLFIFWWGVISLPIHKVEYLKKRRLSVMKVVLFMALLIPVVAVDRWFNIPDNPFTLAYVIAFWLGVFYLIFPKFFTKYRPYILGVYIVIFIYATYVRLFTGNIDQYEDQGRVVGLLFAPVPFIAVLYVYEQWKWLKTLKNEKTTAELELLKTQVNPHFFFNTLNNLYSLTVKHSDQAPEVILKLSDMMRYTIYEGKKDMVSIVDEVTYLTNYIALHEIRHHRRVEIKFHQDVNEEVMVAPLLFIIPLENAFKHGVDTLAENSYIELRLIADETGIHFTISNNFDETVISKEQGIGLENLQRRLDLIYPEQHELKILKKNNIYRLDLNIDHP